MTENNVLLQKYWPYQFFGVMVCLLLCFYSGHFYSNDDATKYESAKAFLTHKTFAFALGTQAYGETGKDGKMYPHFSIGSIFIMMPSACVELITTPFFKEKAAFVGHACAALQNVFITAGLAVLFALICVQSKISKVHGIIYASALIVSTEMLPYSKTSWSEPAALLFLCLACLALVSRQNVHPKKVFSPWIAAGIWCSFALCIRIELLGFIALICALYFITNKHDRTQILIMFLIAVSTLIVHAWFNWYRFGSVIAFGYFGSQNQVIAQGAIAASGSLFSRFFPSNWISAFLSTWCSFGRVHVFWSASLILMFPLALLFHKRVVADVKIWAGSALVIALILVPAFGKNSWTWSNRYLYMYLPFLLLPLAFIIFEKRILRWTAGIVMGIGMIISIMASVTNSHVVLERLVEKYGFNAAMNCATNNFAQAPFWKTVQLAIEQSASTLELIGNASIDKSWINVREKYLDIWPCTAIAAGVPAVCAFGVWLAIALSTSGAIYFYLRKWYSFNFIFRRKK